ncbi:MAG: hypothetical protein IK119_08815 [Bacteroidales bacterium]|nr:hypothetical protein [Bacteroidales bacterium]MBR5432459.1 hypothetical protein [Bacteroidales bacterium]
MKRIILLVLATAVLGSCAPQAYSLLYDMHYPGEAGFVLDNKTMSVVYLNDGNRQDTTYVYSLASGFAKGLERQYFNSEEAVPVISVPKNPRGVYHSKDSLISLMMATDADVLFLFDSPRLTSARDSVQASSYLYVYDGLDRKRDSVIAITLNRKFLNNANLQTSVASFGTNVAGMFARDVRKEYYSLIYYDYSDEWISALINAADSKWEDAMNQWMNIISSTSNVEQKACAAYNMAVGCYMVEDYNLAMEWLDQSDKIHPISLSPGLRQKIRAQLKL